MRFHLFSFLAFSTLISFVHAQDTSSQTATTPAFVAVNPKIVKGSVVSSETTRAHKIENQIDHAGTQQEVLVGLREGWTNPPASYRPHTYWFWPGNAVTPEEISFELQQMKDKGFGGARIIDFWQVYQKGNIEYGSPEFFAMIKFTVQKAQELSLQVELEICPGWNLGNQWVPPADRSKFMAITEQDVPGGDVKDLALSLPEKPANVVNQQKKLDAVIAVRLTDTGIPDPTQRVDLSAGIQGDRDFAIKPDLHLSGHLSDGKWKLMQFWTAFSGQRCTCASPTRPPPFVVDYLDKGAVSRCIENIGSRYKNVVGQYYGQTIDSFGDDSPELTEDFSLWSTGLFERFKKEKGYDLVPYLPLLKYDGAPETAYVREDFGSFLSTVGMESFIDGITSYANDNDLQMRQQPHYRFTTELIEAAGHLHSPETELTRRSFDPSAYPHKLTVSGSQFYPSKEKNWTSAESFTFINSDKYRTSMEQIKQATDSFVRDGICEFFNDGYAYTPERGVSPARALPTWENPISHENTWWPYYRSLADYQARAAFLNRQGRSAAQVLLYSPMPTIWSEQATFTEGRFLGGGGVRGVPFGTLPKLLVASGYDFDCVNDDLLQHHATVQDGKLTINGYSYSALILPKTLYLSPETLKVIDSFVRSGGTVFALNTLPTKSTGLVHHEEHDQQVKEILDPLFEAKGGSRQVGKGMTYFLPDCDGFNYTFSPNAVDWTPTETPSPAYQAFIQDLRSRLQPDFEIANTPLSNGLTFRHTKIGSVDTWFICNLQPNAQKTEVLLKSSGQFPQIWNALTSDIQSLPNSHPTKDGRLSIPVDLQPWESCFVLITDTADKSLKPKPELVQDSSLPVEGKWKVEFSGLGGTPTPTTLDQLTDWRSLPGLADFSGGATYSIDIDLPADFAPNKTTYLDLGEVHEVADVRVNNQDAGKVWMEPYRVNVTGLLHPGKNQLQIHVVNLAWNYAAGLTQPNPMPADLVEHYGADTLGNGWTALQKSKTKHDNDRLPSGLLGPVKLTIYRT